ncbi:MAG TPA: HEPN domain-containing protein [Candidatus Nanoarchaeia archaeon]|nr:HEPN domain-containing protein [Candidatus Nanoarchaeia archaeon]
MRKEIENWWKQAKYDLETAKILLKTERYDAASFYCQQTIEKALKAYILETKKESPGPIHSLIKLANEAKIPEKFHKFLKNLSPDYYLARYPDASEELPYLIYKKTEVEENIKMAQEVIKWLETRMKK